MRDGTVLVQGGRDPEENFGILTPPVYYASTIAFPTVAEYEARSSRLYDGYWYALYGTPTSAAFERSMAELEGGLRAIALPSGMAAIHLVNTTFLGAGDHVLVTDAIYRSTREMCDQVLPRLGIDVTYYDPAVGPGIEALFTPRTRLVWTESPSSITFEIQDIPAITKSAHEHGILVATDNSWASPLFFKPFSHGVDISVHAVSKYIGGHSDLVMGVVTTGTEEQYRALKRVARLTGQGASPHDCFLAHRGLRTLAVRLRHQERASVEVARWLEGRAEIHRVLHPALPSHPGHELWKRDFLGANGLFSVILNEYDDRAVAAFIEGMKCFRLAPGWGGTESLIAPCGRGIKRSVVPWTEKKPIIRLHIGLEEVSDLLEDLEHGLARLAER